MPKEYNHLSIEKKWQKEWERKKTFQAKSKGKKYYSLMEFPYPSGDGLHTGHVRGYTAMDVISRKRRMEDFNVLFPIGWDAFGLPTENYAIKTGIQPAIVTKTNTDNFRKQFKGLGMSFDWSREINTTDPKYYKWTQWIFLQMFKNGLAYKKKMSINWCPKDKIGLANEEVVGGCCERCGTPVEKREKEQWMLAITKYADRLDKDLDLVDYLPQIKTQQRNWIGRSEGAEIDFFCQCQKDKIKVFTTRPDTLFGVTYIVLAPEHKMVGKLLEFLKNRQEVENYIKSVSTKSAIDRMDDKKEKTGVEMKGIRVINPANGELVPIFIADYVLADYGTGAVMAVPAHDDRDFEFAQKYNLPIREVIVPKVTDQTELPRADKKTVERNAIHAIIIDPKTKKILTLRWKKFPWTTFVTGGVEGGEDVIEAARREILEETGYSELKYIKTLGGPVECHFYAEHKDENRKAHFSTIVFELASEKRAIVTEDEKNKHEVAWMSWQELKSDKNLKCAEFFIWDDRFNNPVHAFCDEGVSINSGEFNGLSSEDVKKKITEFAGGKWVETFKLRDWIFSRQRYWGEPIPTVFCENCKKRISNFQFPISNKNSKSEFSEGELANPGWIAIPEKDLPLVLPKVKNYKPTDTGESPLADISSWVNTKCPQCGGKARRETDTMPNWAGSSWYYLRYADPKNSKKFADPKNLKYFTPVDWYNGGMEHTTLHLLYSRFWHKFLYDQKLVPTKEPYQKRTSHGMILAENGEKMSKSRGNVINPDDIVKMYGADTLRVYEMFMGPFDQAIAWDTNSISGSRRFLERVWRLQFKVARGTLANEKNKALATTETLLHKTIQKVTDDIETMHFNTAISAMMILVNEFEKAEKVSREQYEKLILLLSPFAPHIAEELWQVVGNKKSLSAQKWPKADPKKMKESEVSFVVQINGKVRAQMTVPAGQTQDEAVSLAQKMPDVDKWLSGKKIVKTIHIQDRLLNFVIV